MRAQMSDPPFDNLFAQLFICQREMNQVRHERAREERERAGVTDDSQGRLRARHGEEKQSSLLFTSLLHEKINPLIVRIERSTRVPAGSRHAGPKQISSRAIALDRK